MVRSTAARGMEKICWPLYVSVQIFMRSSSVAFGEHFPSFRHMLVEGVKQFLARRGEKGFSSPVKSIRSKRSVAIT